MELRVNNSWVVVGLKLQHAWNMYSLVEPLDVSFYARVCQEEALGCLCGFGVRVLGSSISPRVTLRGELCADRLRIVVFENGSGTELPVYSIDITLWCIVRLTIVSHWSPVTVALCVFRSQALSPVYY